MKNSLRGTVYGEPTWGTSERGKTWASVLIRVEDELFKGLAFDDTAKELSAVKKGSPISLVGRESKGSLVIDAFLIPTRGELGTNKKLDLPPPKLTPMDLVMDRLGATYVNNKIKEWLAQRGRKKDFKSKVLLGVDPVSYKQMFSELWKEAYGDAAIPD